jgi:uncharacterized protein (DUF849 family)
VCLEAAKEVIRRIRQAETTRVIGGITAEQVVVAFPEADVQVTAIAWRCANGLGLNVAISPRSCAIASAM